MLKVLVGVFILLCVTHTSAEARRQGFTCGITMCQMTGQSCKDGLALALNWAKRFPRTSASPGAVVVQTRRGRALGGGPGGHVSQIVSVTSQCRAVVRDNRGTYERDICKNLVAYVSPGGSIGTDTQIARVRTNKKVRYAHAKTQSRRDYASVTNVVRNHSVD